MGRNAGKLALLPALLFLAILLGTGGEATAAPAPSCAEGPVRVGDTIRGTSCDDTIVVPASVASVQAGAGDDTIRAAPLATSADCPSECRLGVGSQIFDGGPGDDVVFGERGNDILNGGEGNDRLFGGIGDDKVLGGPGDDRLAGGFGADAIDGEEGSDAVRGDGTIDRIFDTGQLGVDTLSYATGVTPAFGGSVANPGFPAPGGERGLRIRLGVGGQNAENGIAALGGGVDEVEVGAFETLIGTPFSDLIVGTPRAETFYGGGGADVILGEGGADVVEGGADGDAQTADGAVDPRDPGKVSVGFMAGQPGPVQLYLTGLGRLHPRRRQLRRRPRGRRRLQRRQLGCDLPVAGRRPRFAARRRARRRRPDRRSQLPQHRQRRPARRRGRGHPERRRGQRGDPGRRTWRWRRHAERARR
jgi:hypothetical protein